MPLLLDDDTQEDETAPPEPLVIASLAVSMAHLTCAKVLPESQTVNLVSDFWDDGLNETGDEVVLLAYMAGALRASTFDALAQGLLGRMSGPKVPRLATESDEARLRIRERVADVRSSMRRRRAYIDMLAEVYKLIAPLWEGPSGRRVRRSVDRLHSRIDEGESWRALAGTRKKHHLDRVLAEVGYDIPIILSAALGKDSHFYLDLDDALILSVPLPDAGDEEQAEEVARQLKAVAHPTRLAIVREVARRPLTVGELAKTFGVAQPTVTGHVRQLRDAGLIRHTDGSGRALTVDRSVAQELVDAFGDIAGLAICDEPPVG